jgi:hypothetical protein
MERRDFLKTTLGTVSLAAVGQRTSARSAGLADSHLRELLGYLESLRRSDGGYAWADQAQSHLTPSYAAVGCYCLFQREPPQKDALVEFLRTHHPSATPMADSVRDPAGRAIRRQPTARWIPSWPSTPWIDLRRPAPLLHEQWQDPSCRPS